MMILKILLSLSLLFSLTPTQISYAFDTPLEHNDLSKHIAKFLAKENLVKLRLLSQKTKKNIDNHITTALPFSLMETITTMKGDVSLKNMLSYQNKNFDVLNKTKNSNALIEMINKHKKNKDVFFVLKGSPLRDLMNENIKEEDKYKVVYGEDVYEKEIHKEIFGDKNENDFRKMVLEHHLRPFTFYVPQEEKKDEKLKYFMAENKDSLLKFLKQGIDKKNYVNFEDLFHTTIHMKKGNAHICLSDEHMANPKNKKTLEKLLKKNPDHHLILNVTKNKYVDDNGVLTMSKNDIPSNLKHLTVCDTDKVITSIGDKFLYKASSLTSFDTMGLKKVKTIGNFFLFNAKRLKFFDTMELCNITSIGNKLLDNSPAYNTKKVQEFIKTIRG